MRKTDGTADKGKDSNNFKITKDKCALRPLIIEEEDSFSRCAVCRASVNCSSGKTRAGLEGLVSTQGLSVPSTDGTMV